MQIEGKFVQHVGFKYKTYPWCLVTLSELSSRNVFEFLWYLFILSTWNRYSEGRSPIRNYKSETYQAKTTMYLGVPVIITLTQTIFQQIEDMEEPIVY